MIFRKSCFVVIALSLLSCSNDGSPAYSDRGSRGSELEYILAKEGDDSLLSLLSDYAPRQYRWMIVDGEVLLYTITSANTYIDQYEKIDLLIKTEGLLQFLRVVCNADSLSGFSISAAGLSVSSFEFANSGRDYTLVVATFSEEVADSYSREFCA
jgi:hypothetical protein